jgi:hypothetical protein
MSWLYSQALVAAYSEDTSSGGELFAQSSETPTPRAYLSHGRMMEFSRLSRFGMTCELLTEHRGAALLTWFRAVFLARISAPPGEAPELTESVRVCGDTWPGSFAKYDPDACLWKTRQCSLVAGLDVFLETWPRWGSMRDGACWAQSTPVRPTDESESGSKPNGETLWPTPAASDNRSRGTANSTARRIKIGKQIGLEAAVKYATPTAHNAKEGAYPAEYTRKTPSLASQAGGALNPTWVEWLMGWPLGWTDLQPLGTDRYQLWRRSHGRR